MMYLAKKNCDEFVCITWDQREMLSVEFLKSFLLKTFLYSSAYSELIFISLIENLDSFLEIFDEINYNTRYFTCFCNKDEKNHSRWLNFEAVFIFKIYIYIYLV